MKKFKSCLYWEGRTKYERLRFLFLALICANLLLWIMPESWCRYADDTFFPAVMLLSLFYSLSALVMMFYPTLSLVSGYGEFYRDMERLTGVPVWQRHAAKLAVNLAVTGVLFILVKMGENVMTKFAGETHSYFRMQLDLPAPEMILAVSVLFPVLYIWAYLVLYQRNGNRHGVLAWIIAALLFNMFHFAGIDMVWRIVMRTLICVPFFISAGRMEKRLDI